MDSPLNLAHQQARKADQLLKSGKFEDAIFCHKRAAEHILDAMQLTASNQALDSLKLQHQYHLKQEDLILGRQRKVELMQSNILKSKPTNDGIQRRSVSDAPAFGNPEDDQDHHKVSTEFGDQPVLSEAENYHVYKTMVETDSLLQYLTDRHYGNLSLKYTDLVPQRTKTTDDIVAAAVKTPKGGKTIIEELRIHNEELRRHICLILKELETANVEKDRLAHKLEQFEQAQALYLDNVDSEDIKLPSLDLPPLEMPQFDFDKVNDMTHHHRKLDESKQGDI